MRQKLIRFEANKLRKNIIEPGKPLFDQIKGQWNKIYFEKEQPIVVELGCGNGEYTVGLAEQDPDKNYIGVDVKTWDFFELQHINWRIFSKKMR